MDYYYQWKIRDNEIIVMEEDQSLRDDFFHVMIHLNPYTLRINGRQEKIPYLVAVATAPFCRRQGKMGRVMQYLHYGLQLCFAALSYCISKHSAQIFSISLQQNASMFQVLRRWFRCSKAGGAVLYP